MHQTSVAFDEVPGVQTGPLIVYTQTPRLRVRRVQRVWVDFDDRRAQWLGWLSIVCAVLSVGTDVVGIVLWDKMGFDHDGSNMFLVGWGYYCPVFFLISGSIAVAAATRKTTRLLRALLGTSIVSVFFALVLFGSSAGIISVIRHPENNGHNPYDYGHGYEESSNATFRYINTALALLLLAIGVLETMFSIWLCVLCGPHLCCNRVPAIDIQPQAPQYIISTNPDGTMNQQVEAVPVSPVVGAQGFSSIEAAVGALNTDNQGMDLTDPLLPPPYQSGETKERL